MWNSTISCAIHLALAATIPVSSFQNISTMQEKRVYIRTATQISNQQPLSESWMAEPVMYNEPYVRSIDPSFREWLNPLESRRMGKILKRALVTAMKAMKDAGISQPDAIITGTGLGCIENTEIFLDQLCKEGEEMLKPTCFMQSTHNTISSLIAIYGQCHGYNSTFSHKSISFDSALLDAFIQLRLGDIRHALVTGNDEMTPSYYNILQRTGYVGQSGQVPAGEASVAAMLTTEKGNALCEIEDIRIVYNIDNVQVTRNDVDAILMGVNGDSNNDSKYMELASRLPSVPLLQYKHIFGECYSASALGVYAAAQIMATGKIPTFMYMSHHNDNLAVAKRILVVNHSDGKDFSLITLRKTN